ncbi:MAG: hypothetical protein FWH23_05150 [Bacteroidales bacterium]|nr:hypothetical protein [Bacteroidales bacterium]
MKKILLIAAIVGIVLASCSKNEGGEPTIKGITMTTTAEGDIEIYLSGIGEATIDWGDGTSETVALSNPANLIDTYNYDFPHSYAAAGEKTITLTGNITALMTGWTGAVSALNVSGCPELKYLACNNEDLTSLDVSKNAALIRLECRFNQLTSLDVSKNAALEHLDFSINQLTLLDVSKNIALKYLSCGGNQLTSLDLSKNTALKELYSSSCELTSLDLSKNTALGELQCINNQLTALDLSKNAVLVRLFCSDNPLSALDLNNNSPNLYYVSCSNTDLNLTVLTDIFNALPDRTGTYGGSLYLTDTPGASESGYAAAKAIATAKNWNVIL